MKGITRFVCAGYTLLTVRQSETLPSPRFV